MTAIFFSSVEVTSINRHGFWLSSGGEELYVPFVEFPDFEHATVSQLCRVEHVGFARLFWPALGIDLAVDAIRDPVASHCDGLGYN